MNLFIDSSVYLSFYHFSSDDLEQLKKLVVAIRSGKIKLLFTTQVIDEFNRNRESKITDALKKFIEQNPSSSFPQFIEGFAQRHFIKGFVKKHKSKHWEVTLTAIKSILARYDNIAPNHKPLDSKLDVICPCGQYMVVKLDFAIAGTQTFPKSSGNRVVAAVDTENKIIKILLVYSKNDIGPPNETVKWKNKVASNYEEFKNLK